MLYYLLAFVRGARFKTLPCIIMPICMATTWAFYKTNIFHLDIFCWTLASGMFLQMSVNFFNDALDFKFGTDTLERQGPIRLVQSGTLSINMVFGFGFLCAGLSVLAALVLIDRGGWAILLLGVLALLASYFYTGYSFSLIKKGLAELSVFFFFGILAVGGTYYLQTLTLDYSLMYLGVQSGLWALSILLVNYLRDEKEDLLSDRKNIITTYGRSIGLLTFAIIQCFIYLLCFYWLDLNIKGGAFSFFMIIPSCFLIYFVCNTPPSKKYNLYLFLTSLLYVLFGTSWILGVLF